MRAEVNRFDGAISVPIGTGNTPVEGVIPISPVAEVNQGGSNETPPFGPLLDDEVPI